VPTGYETRREVRQVELREERAVVAEGEVGGGQQVPSVEVEVEVREAAQASACPLRR
jgi:hypothetical protein